MDGAGRLNANIDALFAPRNVVLVGASDRNWSARVHLTLGRLGFAGDVYLVNPNRKELWGKPCYPSVAELPEAPDHLAVFVPADDTIRTIEAAAPLGARSASLFAAGFGEGGDPEGAERAARLKAAIERSGIAAVGPNCMGLAVGRSRFATLPDEQLDVDARGPVAIVTQSGMLIQTLSRGIQSGGAALPYLISCGNQVGLTFADYIDYLKQDEDIRVIACYIESVRDSDRFFAAAAKARDAGKTVVVTKIGGSEKARHAALAHTGSLAGSLHAFDVYARENGVVRAETIEDLVESCIFLAKARRPKGRRIAVITNSGAVKSLSSEAGEALEVSFAEFAPATRERIATALSDVEVSNPLDTKRTLTTEQYLATVTAVHDDPSVDMVLIAEELPRAAGIERKLKNFTALDDYIATTASKPIVCFSPVTSEQNEYIQGVRRDLPHIPWLRDMSKTLRVASRLAPIAHAPLRASPRRSATPARRRLQDLGRDAPRALDEPTSKDILRQFGIRTPNEAFVPGWSFERVAEAAAALTLPLVVKVVSALAHKSDAGLVILNVRTVEDLRRAYDTLTERCAKHGVNADGLLVAEQLSDGIEVVVGLHRDPEAGPVVMFGAGGVLLELVRDVAFGPPGLDAPRAREMIRATRVAKMLEGYRGAPPGDIDGLVDVLVAMGVVAQDLGDLVESVDVNPLLVRPDGVFALDALIVTRAIARELAVIGGGR
ncbi:MAG: acetate--CoA ligase family protein [Gemmatimonas sp.]